MTPHISRIGWLTLEVTLGFLTYTAMTTKPMDVWSNLIEWYKLVF